MSIRDQLREHQAHGYTIGQLHTLITNQGVKVSSASLYVYASGHREPSPRLATQLQQALEAIPLKTVKSVEWLCGGSITGVVSHLLESREVNAAELDALEALIQKHKLQQ
jgi:hypothetical protein